MDIVPVKDIPKAEPVPLDDPLAVYKICSQMERVCTARGGVGLSAVQVGIPWKLFLILVDPKAKHYRYMVNCEYTPVEHSEKIKSIEGCLSLLDEDGQFRRFEVERYSTVKVEGMELRCHPDLRFHEHSAVYNLDDEYSQTPLTIVVQHEIDHHRDVLISDIGQEIELR
jgi:peptide deformylase